MVARVCAPVRVSSCGCWGMKLMARGGLADMGIAGLLWLAGPWQLGRPQCWPDAQGRGQGLGMVYLELWGLGGEKEILQDENVDGMRREEHPHYGERKREEGEDPWSRGQRGRGKA